MWRLGESDEGLKYKLVQAEDHRDGEHGIGNADSSKLMPMCAEGR